MEKLRYKLAHPGLLWLFVWVGILLFYLLLPKGSLFYSGPREKGIMFLGILYWIFIVFVATRVHPQVRRSAANINKIVTEGAYAVVRHPLYSANIVLAWTVFIAYPKYWVLAGAAWVSLIMVFWANFEERALEERFLADYAEYKKHVPMFIPRMGRRRKKTG